MQEHAEGAALLQGAADRRALRGSEPAGGGAARAGAIRAKVRSRGAAGPGREALQESRYARLAPPRVADPATARGRSAADSDSPRPLRQRGDRRAGRPGVEGVGGGKKLLAFGECASSMDA